MLSRSEALQLLANDDLIGLAMQADALRLKLHPERIVTYYNPEIGAPLPSHIALLNFEPAESNEQHLDRLENVRAAQQQRPTYVAAEVSFRGSATGFLKLLAVSRLYLENIPHIRVTCVDGFKICQIALRFGANDIGGAEYSQHRQSRDYTNEEFRVLIREAGFIPRERDALFQTYYLA